MKFFYESFTILGRIQKTKTEINLQIKNQAIKEPDPSGTME